MTLGSGWNIPVDLTIGPHVGISYLTHAQASPTKVTDFQNIERITTSVLSTPKDNANNSQSTNDTNGGPMKSTSASNNISNGKSSNSPLSQKKNDKRTTTTSACTCNEIKTLLKIKATGNADDLTITCNGIKTAESIADLVDGYCRIVNNTESSLWERSTGRTPSGSATNSLEKQKHSTNATASTTSQANEIDANDLSSTMTSTATGSGESSIPILNEDYVDIGLGEEEGDYSTPAVRNYELDRTQITLNEIIGIGQFGDVHIGTCRINKIPKPKTCDDPSQATAANGTECDVRIIHVAVKTCKADADLITTEKFLEEACECEINGLWFGEK